MDKTINDVIKEVLSSQTGIEPIKMIQQIMDSPLCRMHGPEHHIMVGACLLKAYANAGGDINFDEALEKMIERGSKVPGGVCGNWGSCGAAISTGIFISIVTGASPTTTENWGLANLMTSESLKNIGKTGGPRCCKRDSFTAIKTAVEYVKNNLSVNMQYGDVVCTYYKNNPQCIKERCPFNPANN